MDSERIVFFGTPDFAAYQLEYLINNKAPIVAVVTTPDRPQGRGRKLKPCAVKEMALKFKLPVLEPNNLKHPDFVQELRSYKATIQIVVAFRMLPEVVWNMPPRGTLNLHASLLPNYRGAAPINHAIINGETETGVSTFLLKHKIDTGNILMQKSCEITANETAGDLHDKLMILGAPVILETIKGIFRGDIKETEQDHLDEDSLKHAPKIFKDDCLLDLKQDITDLFNRIRGLSPFPTAFINVEYQGQKQILKLYKAELLDEGNYNEPRLFREGKNLVLQGKKGQIKLLEVQLSGKQRMKSADFCNGVDMENIKICL